MASKTFITVVAVCLVQGLFAVPMATPDTAVKTIRQQEVAIQQVRGEVRNIVDVAEQAIQKLIAFLQEKTAEVLGNAEKVLQAAVEALEKKMKELQEKGEDIAVCLGQQLEEARWLVKEVMENVRQCLYEDKQKATVIMEEVMAIVAEARQVAVDADQKIRECRLNNNLLGAALCIADVTAKAEAEALRLSLKLASKVVDVNRLILSLITNLAVCGSSQVISAQDEIRQIVQSMVSCVADNV